MDSARFIAVGRGVSRGWVFVRTVRGWRVPALGLAASFAALHLLVVTFAGAHIAFKAVLDRAAVRLDVAPGVADQRVQELYAALSTTPTLRDVTYLPREQVLAEERARDPSLETFLAQSGIANPFTDAFVVLPRGAGAYNDLRAFVKDSDGAVDAASLSAIASQEEATVELLGTVETARAGVGALLALVAVATLLLAGSLAANLTLMRRGVSSVEAIAGATQAVVAVPTAAAAFLVLIASLVLGVVFAALIVTALSVWSSSALMGAWLANASFNLLPLAPFILAVEAALIALVAWAGARTGSSPRS